MGARARRGLRAAVQTYYTVVFYNTVTRVLKWLGAGSFFEWLTPRLETAYARLSGTASSMQAWCPLLDRSAMLGGENLEAS